MSLTHIDELPTSPDRLANYTTFTTDAPIFIDALAPFIAQVNSNLVKISTYKPNKWNMGGVVETNIFPTFTTYSATPDALPKPSVQYVSAIDQEWAYFKTYSQDVNNYLSWFENILIERGSVNSWSTSLNILPLSNPMTRVMGGVEFNRKATALSQSMRDHTKSVHQNKQQMDNWFNTTMDMGYITDAVTTTIDCGNITDTTISN